MNSIELIVVHDDDWCCRCVLAQDVGLLQTDGQCEVFAGLGEAGPSAAAIPVGCVSPLRYHQ